MATKILEKEKDKPDSKNILTFCGRRFSLRSKYVMALGRTVS